VKKVVCAWIKIISRASLGKRDGVGRMYLVYRVKRTKKSDNASHVFGGEVH